jgi:hypothetical protein
MAVDQGEPQAAVQWLSCASNGTPSRGLTEHMWVKGGFGTDRCPGDQGPSGLPHPAPCMSGTTQDFLL